MSKDAPKLPDDVRENFPALRPLAGEPNGSVEAARVGAMAPGDGIVYLDNAATTHKPTAVFEVMEDVPRTCNANPFRGAYRTSVMATKLYEGSRVAVAEFVGADKNEIVFTKNATEAVNLVAQSWARENLQPGDEIAVTRAEHHSNLVPWQNICRITGAKLTFLELDLNGRLGPHELSAKIGERTKLVAFAHASNVLGTVLPAADIAKRAHEVGALALMDCAQTVAHIPLDLREANVDFAVFSAHKMYGPAGMGALFARADLLDAMPPFMLGGEMIDIVLDQRSSYAAGPKKFEAGTPNVAGAVGFAAAANYLQETGRAAVAEREKALTAHLLEGMREIDAVRIYGNPYADDDRLGVVSFNLAGIHAQDVALTLDKHNIAVRSGAHCAQPLHRALGIDTSCRASIGLYNTFEEIDLFLGALEDIRHDLTRHIMRVFP